MAPSGGNILADIPSKLLGERIAELVSGPNVLIERIVSTGQSSPPGQWYDQDRAEWVLVVLGSCKVRLDGEAQPRLLGPGGGTSTFPRMPDIASNGPIRCSPRCGSLCIVGNAVIADADDRASARASSWWVVKPLPAQRQNPFIRVVAERLSLDHQKKPARDEMNVDTAGEVTITKKKLF